MPDEIGASNHRMASSILLLSEGFTSMSHDTCSKQIVLITAACIEKDSWGESNPIHPQKRSASSRLVCADKEKNRDHVGT